VFTQGRGITCFTYVIDQSHGIRKFAVLESFWIFASSVGFVLFFSSLLELERSQMHKVHKKNT